MLSNTISTFLTFDGGLGKAESIWHTHSTVILLSVFFEISVYFLVQHNWHRKPIPNEIETCHFIGCKSFFVEKSLIITLEEMACVGMS